MPRTTTPLSPKELLFVAEWLVDKNAKQAAIRAGYSPKNAGKTAFLMLQKPRIMDAINAALEAQQKRTLISADQVLHDIDRIATKAETAGEFNAALKGKELLGKHYKLFTEKHELTGKDGVPLRPLAELSTEEIRAALANFAKVPGG